MIVIGSRKITGARSIRSQTLLRVVSGKLGNKFIKLLATPGISDTQCGFKCFKREVAVDLFNRQKINDWAFDVEILYLAQRLNYKIKEMPVFWTHRKTGHITAIDYLKTLINVVKIRYIHRHL